STLLPLHRGPIEVTRFSLFNARTHPRFPLHSVKLKNTTGQPLLQGPVSVRDGGPYAGDCRLPDMAPGDERILSFAMDLGVEVRTQVGDDEEQKPLTRVSKGRLEVTPITHRSIWYTITNRSKSARTVIVEHPRQEGWSPLPHAKPTETTTTHGRYSYKVE